MNRNRLIFAWILVVLLSSGYSKVTAEEGKEKFTVPSERSLQESNASASSKVIEVNTGEEFAISLESNKTTGYEWQLAEPLDRDIFLFVNSKYIRNDSSLIGSGGKEIWTFKALTAGKTAILFRYVRPWEKNTSPVKKESFAIVITKKEQGKIRVGGDITVTSVNRKEF